MLSFDKELGCRIDGFTIVVARAHVLKDGPVTRRVTGRVSDVLTAVNTASEVAMRLLRPGKKVLFSTKFHCGYFVLVTLWLLLLYGCQ
jgi:hypothetical protein